MNATPKKLRNGDWGALVKSERVNKGDTVAIKTKSGKSWTATVSKVIWKGDGVAICATASNRSGGGARRRSSNGECNCGANEDLLSIGFRPGQRIRCDECGGWAEAC